VSTLETPLVELIFDRLVADGVPAKTADVVLAALAGDDDLAAVLIGQPPRLDLDTAGAGKPRPHIYLASVTVSGFRGVGPDWGFNVPGWAGGWVLGCVRCACVT